jgi:hypothetical protein
MRQDLQSWAAGFNYKDWQSAAQFCADNKINLEESLTWADKAIDGPFRGPQSGTKIFPRSPPKPPYWTSSDANPRRIP